ncbi:hypothetical protein SAMN05421874_12877 [Nonomuraea maritima]|uniref:Uncharacterized protein n=1 Tax=Nonomuraea maritima TaxID=683260 RepID=A0A1G9MKC8_9ACTN|nr:hypothetical protein [Nonomuraea maritima]SDL74740.1 hypothetical protein SAMN05421874_12877 [Nonomuraea maritima]
MTSEEQFGISPNDPLGTMFTADTIQMLVGQRNSLLGQAEQVRQRADQEIAGLKQRARQLEALIRYADLNRDPSSSQPSETTECTTCGRTAKWMTGFGWYHDIDGKPEPAGDQCKSEPLATAAQPARLPESSRA